MRLVPGPGALPLASLVLLCYPPAASAAPSPTAQAPSREAARGANPLPRCSDYVPPTVVAPGDTFYVNVNDPQASDSNDGSVMTYESDTRGPWATIQKALWTMDAGDITYIKAGLYRETNLAFTTSGTDTAPIVLSAYGFPGSFDEVILDGSADTTHPVGIYLADSTSHIVLQGLTIQNMKYGILTDDPGSGYHQDIVIREVTVRNNGFPELSFPGAGMYLQVLDGFTLDGVTAYGNAGDGIQVIGGALRHSQNGYVVNCISYDNDDGLPDFVTDAHGIAINQGYNIAICNCRAYGNHDHGIDVSDWPKGGSLSHHITLEDNISYGNDNAGFSVNSDSHHILYLRNLAYGNYVGFVAYSGCGHVEFLHNVSMHNRNQGFLVEPPYAVFEDPGDNTLLFVNNIATGNDTIQYNYPALEVGADDLQYQVVATHNDWDVSPPTTRAAWVGTAIYWPPGIEALGAGNVSLDPAFVDPGGAAPDVHLLATSPLIDAGEVVSINGVPEDFLGAAPEPGLYEFAGATPVPEGGRLDSGDIVLGAVSPNPFRAMAEIRYTLGREARVSLTVLDVAGRVVRRLVRADRQRRGGHSVRWDGRGDKGEDLASGVYFVELRAGGATAARKIVLVRP